MTDPNKTNFDDGSFEHKLSHSFSGFQRIQVERPRWQEVKEYQELPVPHQQELLSRLIDHVRDL
jgi:hypothetical protein